jgi:hypothetical protein
MKPRTVILMLLNEVNTDHPLDEQGLVNVLQYQVWCPNTTQGFSEPKDPVKMGTLILDSEENTDI